MKEITLEVDISHNGERLDKYLVNVLKSEFSRTFIKKMIDSDHISVNEKGTNAHHKVAAGETIRIIVPDPKPVEVKPEKIPLEIVYEDKDLLVVNKPVGIAVHPAGGSMSKTLVNALLYHCNDLSGIGGVLRPGIVHRLDKDTSGLLVIAKNDVAHINLSGQFRNRTIKRKYIAIVKGIVQLDHGRIELPIARKKKDITKMGVSFTDEKKKEAITNYAVLKRFKNNTMLEVFLETGRTHQIRVHLSHMGHPIIGDGMYGSSKLMSRPALHAKTLGFFHPGTKKFMEFKSEIPDDMKGLLDRLNRE